MEMKKYDGIVMIDRIASSEYEDNFDNLHLFSFCLYHSCDGSRYDGII